MLTSKIVHFSCDMQLSIPEVQGISTLIPQLTPFVSNDGGMN